MESVPNKLVNNLRIRSQSVRCSKTTKLNFEEKWYNNEEVMSSNKTRSNLLSPSVSKPNSFASGDGMHIRSLTGPSLKSRQDTKHTDELGTALNNVSRLAEDQFKLRQKHQEEVKKLKDEVEKYKTKLKSTKDTLQKSEEQNMKTLDEFRMLQNYVSNIPSKIETQQLKHDLNCNATLIKQLQGELTAAREENKTLRQYLTVKSNDLKSAHSELQECQINLKRADEQISYLKEYPHKECHVQLASVTDRLNGLSKENTDSQKRMSALAQKYREKKLKYELALADMQTKLKAEEDISQHVRRENEELKTKLEQLEDELSRHDASVSTHKSNLDESVKNLRMSESVVHKLNCNINLLQQLIEFTLKLKDGQSPNDSFLFDDTPPAQPSSTQDAVMKSISKQKRDIDKIKQIVLSKYSDHVAEEMSSCLVQ